MSGMEAIEHKKWRDGGETAVPAPERRERNLRPLLWTILGVSLLASIYLLAYTPVSRWLHDLRMEAAISSYDKAAGELTAAEKADILSLADEYNSNLDYGTHFFLSEEDLAEYDALLDPEGTGMMGYIEIPKIDVRLPIYHEANEDTMAEAVGHIPGSSLPIGGESCHTVLCGHRDQSTAYIFHDLDKLALGDTFTLTALGREVTYRVDKIQVVLPDEIGSLAIEEGADRCTLVTCHPHGSSAYRLLVRGTRVS